MLPENNLSDLELSPSDDDEINLFDLLIALGRHKWLVLGMPIFFGLVSLVISLMIPPIFTSTVTLLPPQQQESSGVSAILGQLGNLGGIAGGLSGMKSPDELYVAMLGSRTIADKLIKQFDLRARYKSKTMDDTYRGLASATQISAGKKDGVISISISDKDPKFAADLANAYVEQLTRLTQTMAVTDASRRRLFFEHQMKDAKEQVTIAENALVATQRKTGMIQPEGQVKMLISTIAEIKGEIIAKEVQLNSMRTFASEHNPDVMRTQEELRSLRGQLAKMEKRGATTGRGFSVPAGQFPAASLEYVRNLRDVKYYETIFELLARQYELAKVDEAKGSSMIQVLDKAIPPERKSRPRRALIVFTGFGFGAIFGILSALLRERLMRSWNDPTSRPQWQKLQAAWRS